ncbi:MAG: translation initiation factor IF-3 [Sulfurimonas sp. CG08_land_8_20_14_0_20_36_33]|nr:MAG: translation initiation factor IF-3 [Helicobacteraceae bacterium CG1_02_36_14]PIP11131.1 MAG: translation initiation factor IF-3 [Sulfurimonas sp. CG23_combo_of_CG06-09_8_20_14_all_36_33]PIS26612.1 MAG: translation initiation factor IF-3 [Sulfurimonas sp. CG08_land_8_20_14_0_20_36_33]PIU34370.1 MAG: translation initiation factor IF-3 [Sulfurimonas sp. CG07_land_8_20_14_0_80_36_56]PIV05318.1 MAG: translation initiation factor IF-3 [Sulfurimonas sp. CG03_land_8_20_14_0_80_36_25]PIV34296.1
MSKKDRVIMNDDIRVAELRCNVDGGESLGIISTDEAMEKANALGLDLVLIAPDAKPPVAKIMDYGKFKYQEEKKLKEQRKNQTKIDVKEIKLSVKIAENDIAYKVKHAREFLSEGKHVKFRVFLRGREMAHPEAGKEVLLKVWPMVEDLGTMDKPPRFEGRYFNMYIIPNK